MGDGGVRQAPKSGPGSAGGASGNQTESAFGQKYYFCQKCGTKLWGQNVR